MFNEYGRIYNLKSDVISGSDDTLQKEALIRQLQSDQSGTINYLFAVDVLNEGVDIPSLNQIIMLRPTQSAIIFVQQLGRGLRKFSMKEYVLVLDFIGNYTNNFHIPLALSSDRTYQKETLRRFVHEGTKLIYGPSTINLERVVKDRIFESLDKVRFNHKKFLISQFDSLVQRLNRLPSLMDFEKEKAMDPTLFFANKDFRSYHFFLEKEKHIHYDFSSRQWDTIAFLSSFIGYGKRPHEAILIEIIIQSSHLQKKDLAKRLINYDVILRTHDWDSLFKILSNQWLKGAGRKSYKDVEIIDPFSKEMEISNKFKKDLENLLFKRVVLEIIEFSKYRFEHYYKVDYQASGFVLYQTYTAREVMQLCGWEEMEIELNVGGYKYDEYSKTLPIFVNYHKDDSIQSSIQYHDHFVSKDKIGRAHV